MTRIVSGADVYGPGSWIDSEALPVPEDAKRVMQMLADSTPGFTKDPVALNSVKFTGSPETIIPGPLKSTVIAGALHAMAGIVANEILAIRDGQDPTRSVSVDTDHAAIWLGANQEFSLSRSHCTDIELLKRRPDAAPWVPLRDSLSPKQFLEIDLWKAVVVEGLGTCLLVYLTILFPVGLLENMSNLATGPVVPTLIGSVMVIFMLPLFKYTIGPISGAHLNPLITIATFFGRLTTLPICVMYVAFQVFGSAIAGWLVRASLDTRSDIPRDASEQWLDLIFPPIIEYSG